MRTSRLHIDFAPGARRISWLPRVLLGLVLVALLASATQLGELLAGQARLTERLAALEARRGVEPGQGHPSAPPDRTDLVRVKAVREVAQKLVTPWSDLLQSLESAPNQSVALLAVEPSTNKRSVRLTAEARSAADMLNYLRALQQDARLATAVLVSHQVQAQTAGTPVRFQIQAQWGTAP